MNDLHLKRKGTFLRNFYSNPNLILQDDKGQLTEASTAALSWGEPAPVTKEDVLHLAVIGEVLSQRAEQKLSQAVTKPVVPLLEKGLASPEVLDMPGGTINLQLLSQGLLRVPLAMKGKWCHPEYGNVEFTEQDFKEVVDNYKNDRLGFEPYLTFGHLDADIASTDAQRKNGNLENLSINNDVFYGDFSINEKTAELVANGEYEYSSGEFIRNFMDKDTGDARGTAFLRVALTNAPFLPFKEKVQLLSQGLQPKTTTQLPFVVALSTSVIKQVDKVAKQTQVLNTELTPMSTNVDKSKASEVQQNLSVDNVVVAEPTTAQVSVALDAYGERSEKPTVADAIVASTVEKTPVEIINETPNTLTTMNSYVPTPPVVTPTVTADDLSALAKQLNEIKSGYQEQLVSANTTIGELTKQVNELNAKVGAQEVVTHAFSQSMTKAQEELLYNKMVEGGISPALVQRFSQLKSALDKSATKTVKLSTKAADGTDTESETDLIESIAELMLEVSNTESVAYQQFGTAVAKPQDAGDFSEIIQKNRELAKTRTLGVH